VHRTAYILSIMIAALAALAAIGGLALNIYRDNAFVTTAWKGNDAITLVLGVPTLVVAMFWSRRGRPAAQLVWMGMLDYMLYNYAFYLFAAKFNALFLVYAALLGLCIFALLFGLTSLQTEKIRRQFRGTTPVNWIAGYFLFVALGLTAVYVTQAVGFIFSGEPPAIVVMSGHPTSIVFALDLTLLVPWLVVGAVWLIKRRTWGYVIAGMINVKGPLYTLILTVNTWLIARAGLADESELPLWAMLTVLGLIASILFYRSLSRANGQKVER
jgi:hypothetical protein